jgi:hypothetical protein
VGNVSSFTGVQVAEELGRELLSREIYRTHDENNQVQGNKFKKELIFLGTAIEFSAFYLWLVKWKYLSERRFRKLLARGREKGLCVLSRGREKGLGVLSRGRQKAIKYYIYIERYIAFL